MKTAPFAFMGYRDGWYFLRVSETFITHLYQQEIIDWLISERITLNKWAMAGNDYRHHDGDYFTLRLKRPADLIRFETRFACVGITPDSLLKAVRQEATRTRLNADGIARVVHDAIASLSRMAGEEVRAWEDFLDVHRQMFITDVQYHIQHPDRTPREVHHQWVADRRHRGWSKGPLDYAMKFHPSLIPFEELSPLEKAKDALFISVIVALMPLQDN